MSTRPYAPARSALPDPVLRPEFYAHLRTKRLVAWVIDTTLIGVASAVLLPFTAFAAVFFFPLFMLVVGFAYRWATLAAGSATWGMVLMAVQLRDAEGYKVTANIAFWHTLGYSLSIAMAPLQLVSLALMVLTPRRQGLTDLVLGTGVINRPGLDRWRA